MQADICSICCGTEREVSVHCPLDCVYLQEARRHEEPPVVDPATFPNQDIPVTEQFLKRNEELLVVVGMTLLTAGLEAPGAVDTDVRDALASIVRTYRTLQSGLYYESRPANLIAASIQERVQEEIKTIRKGMTESGAPAVRDADLLGIFAFLQRMELQQNNGRRLSRAFLDFLLENLNPPEPAPGPSPTLITP